MDMTHLPNSHNPFNKCVCCISNFTNQLPKLPKSQLPVLPNQMQRYLGSRRLEVQLGMSCSSFGKRLVTVGEAIACCLLMLKNAGLQFCHLISPRCAAAVPVPLVDTPCQQLWPSNNSAEVAQACRMWWRTHAVCWNSNLPCNMHLGCCEKLLAKILPAFFNFKC